MNCRDCKGSGKYVGFTAAEPCRACGGTGKAEEVSVQHGIFTRAEDFDPSHTITAACIGSVTSVTTPAGLRCPQCNSGTYIRQRATNNFICPHCLHEWTVT